MGRLFHFSDTSSEVRVRPRRRALAHMDRQIFADVSQLSPHHPCAAQGCNQTGFCSHNPASWPPDAIRGVQRLMWVTRRAGRTASMLIAGFTEVSVRGGVNVEDFPYPVRIGVGDAHCSEVQLACATFWREGRDEPCVARLIPSYIFADWKEPGMHGEREKMHGRKL